ncbi:SHOCT domain-containing protein [Motiliproteus sp. MSK22-1]|uniref:SHOCT domain-containing protein n=1 Tax=Motiliproteus sp. MSK22-1 TaxID=1897630 RepID=UPI0009F903AD|nr:hypothetical protein [Motiliproteus sp. MSK22-1]
MHDYGFMDNGWGMGIGMILMLVIGGLAIVGVFAILRWITQSSRNEGRQLSEFAEASLKERYAKGEIDQAAYHEQLGEIRKE